VEAVKRLRYYTKKNRGLGKCLNQDDHPVRGEGKRNMENEEKKKNNNNQMEFTRKGRGRSYT